MKRDLGLVCLAVCAIALPVSAQVSTTSSPPAGDSGLTEIVVTAERRSESIQSVPAVIQSVSGDDLADSGKVQLDDALKTIPNATVETGPRGFLVRIRGIGLDLPPSVGDPTVSVSKDDIVDDRTETTKAGFYDLDRMEVLSGPQGTLYGRNSTGGAVNVLSHDPVLGRTEGYLLAEAGDYSLLHAEGAYNVPLGDTVAVRVAGTSVSRDGYLTNGSNDNQTMSGRLRFLFQPSGAIRLVVTAEQTKLGGKGSSSVPSWSSTAPADPWDNTTPILTRAGPPFVGYGAHGFLHGDNSKYFLRADVDVGIGVLTVIPAAQDYREHYKYPFAGGPPIPDYYYQSGSRETQNSIEARLASHDTMRVKWVVGVFDYRENGHDVVEGVPVTDPSYTDARRLINSFALFGQLTVPVGERSRFTAGARQTRDHKEGVDIYNVTEAPQPLNCLAATPCTYSRSWSKPTYKGSYEFDVAPRDLLYVSYSTGFTSGGYNFSDNTYFDPETLHAWQFGSKNTLLGNRLRLNGDFFYYDYQNYQAGSQINYADIGLTPPPGQPPFFLHVGTASARALGAELETLYQPIGETQLGLNVAWLDASFRHFNELSDQIYDGRRLPTSPRMTVTGSIDQSFLVGGSARLTAHIDARYESTSRLIYSDLPPFATGVEVEPAHTIVDAALSMHFARDRYSIVVNGKNLTNHPTKLGVFGPFDLAIGPPRTFSVVLSTRF